MPANLPSPPPEPRLSLLRRSRRGGLADAGRTASELWSRSFELPALWLALFLLVGTWSIMPSGFLFAPRVQVGEIAGRDYVATRSLLIQDDESTAAKAARARDGVLPVYDFDPGVEAERDGEVAALFTRGRELLAQGGRRDRAEVVQALAEELA